LPGYVLESTTNLPASTWAAAPGATNITGSSYIVTLPASEQKEFIRLHKQ